MKLFNHNHYIYEREKGVTGMWLQVRMYLLLGALFGIVYALIVTAGSLLGIGNFLFYGILATVMMLIQYMIGPKIVEWTMKVRYVTEKEEPELHKMVGELSRQAKIPKPRVGVAKTRLPNAFAFGRWQSDSRVCVTEGVMSLLDKNELRAVLGHEIAHIKNRDVTVITIISVIPSLAWYIAWSSMFAGDRKNAAVGIFAFVVYFLTNLLVLYGSRIREYYADRGSIELGNKPHHLASALYKLVYGSAKCRKEDMQQAKGMKAFFASDPTRAHAEIRDLSKLDANFGGSIDSHELETLRHKKISVSKAEKLVEILSTHPNMLKRISVLAKHGS
ncbi:MAG: zinc metalloprotease HtpX [Candidatus Aenigmatarchaeota archaeon]